VFPAPVSAVGIAFLLRPVNPTTDAAPVLAWLVRRQLARFHNGTYDLHPVDRGYARGQLPPGDPRGVPAAFTLTGLQACAADSYTQIRTRVSPSAPSRTCGRNWPSSRCAATQATTHFVLWLGPPFGRVEGTEPADLRPSGASPASLHVA
jgi:hypothetical protein